MRFLFRWRKWRNEELNEEIQGHLELAARENMESGLDARGAQTAARREFGSIALAEEVTRDMWGGRWFVDLLQDVRYGLRMLRKSPGFTAIAVLTLALGIGATTAIFSVLDAVLLKSLPYRQADKLVLVQELIPKVEPHAIPVSAPDFLVMRRENHVFDSLAAFQSESLDLSGTGEPQRILAARVSANLFPMLGAPPLLGRTFSPDEDPPGHFVAILSYGLWQGHFGGDPRVIGNSIALDSQPYTIIGVMPASFEFPPRGMPYAQTAELWVPIAFTKGELAALAATFNYGAIARLKNGVTLAQARSDMSVVANDVLKTWYALGPQIASMGLTLEAPVTPLQQAVTTNVRPLLYLLLAAVGFLLLIACANVANLLLSRATGRQKEISVRAALGAGRTRIVRQLLTESVILALLGGAFGLLIAIGGTRALAASAPDNIPQVHGITVDATVLVFAMLISIITGVLFGLAPAVGAARVNLNDALKESGRSSGSSRRVLFARDILVIAQVSIAFLLVIGGGLFVRSFVRAADSSAGVEPRNVIIAALTLPGARYADPWHVDSFFQQVFARLKSDPGVDSVGAATALPTEMGLEHTFSVEEHPLPASAQLPDCWHSLVLGNYFGALGVHLVAGHFFTPAEEQGKSKVVIISAEMAKHYFPGENPLGKHITFGAATSDSPWLTIVGVVNDVKQGALDQPTMPQTYAPYLQDCADTGMMATGICSSLNIAIRARMAGPTAITDLRSAVAHLDSAEPIMDAGTLTGLLQNSIAPREFNTFLLGVFACAALFLAAIGLYSVLAYRVAQQMREIGIRVAFGAQRGDILRGVLASGARLVLFGLVLGAAAALALTRLMQSLLYDISATDPPTFVAVAVLLSLIALLACYIPARRAMRVDPVSPLRCE